MIFQNCEWSVVESTTTAKSGVNARVTCWRCSVASSFKFVAGRVTSPSEQKVHPEISNHDCTVWKETMTSRTGGSDVSTPKATLKKSTSGSQSLKGQKSILGFFGKKGSTPSAGAPAPKFESKVATQLTPAPSSDAAAYSSPIAIAASLGKNKENGLPSPASPLSSVNGADRTAEGLGGIDFSSPSRKVRLNSYMISTRRSLL
jgi:hypothetical protein